LQHQVASGRGFGGLGGVPRQPVQQQQQPRNGPITPEYFRQVLANVMAQQQQQTSPITPEYFQQMLQNVMSQSPVTSTTTSTTSTTSVSSPAATSTSPTPTPTSTQTPTSNVQNLPPEARFRSQLETLNEMGFSNNTDNIAALNATNGDVQAAIQRLLGA